jgi:hypothetical protein
MEESKKVEAGIRNDEDLNRVREAHAKLGSDIEQGLVEALQEAQTGMQVAVENKTEPSTRMTRSNSSSRTGKEPSRLASSSQSSESLYPSLRNWG